MKNLFKAGAVASLGSLVLAGQAQAAVPEGVTSALTSLGTDASSVATTVLIAVIVVFAIKFIRKGM